MKSIPIKIEKTITSFKKIYIITSPFACIPPFAIGAAEKLWYQIAEYWKSQGHAVHFICKAPRIIPNDNNKYIKGYERTGSLIKDVIIDIWYSIKALYVLEKCDYIIPITFWSPIFSVFCRWKYKKSLFTVSRFPKGQMALYNTCDIIACVSTAVKDTMIRQSPSTAKRAVVIPNPIDTSIFTADSPKQISSEVTIVFAGRVNREKGIDLLIQAVDRLCRSYKIRVMIIGPTDIRNGGSGEKYVQELNEYAHGWSIDWVDSIYNAKELAAKMSEGQIFCYPSVADTGETFGVAPLESMGLGMVPIVSGLKCFEEFVENGENCMVFDHKAENAVELLAENILYLINNPKRFEQMSMNAILTSKKFDVKKIADMYMKVLSGNN